MEVEAIAATNVSAAKALTRQEARVAQVIEPGEAKQPAAATVIVASCNRLRAASTVR